MKPLPHSLELERACLGACLLAPESFTHLGLADSDFHGDKHREIWRALDALQVEGEPFDLHTLQGELERRGSLGRAGGLAYLAGLDAELPSLDHAQSYARRLRDFRRRRERIVAAHRYVQALYEGGEAVAGREEALARLLAERDADDHGIPLAVDVEQFLAIEFPPRPWLVEGLVQQKDAGMVHAWRGVGKTHFVLSLTWALVSAGSFLRFRVPEPAGVLFIDGEMPREDLQQRLARIVRAARGERRAPLRILAADMSESGLPSLATPEGQSVVDFNLGSHPEIRVVVVDNVSTLCGASGQGENDAESWNAVQEYVLRLRRQGISVIFVHHSNKSLSQRGTSKREDILSWVLDLRRPDDYRDEDGARFEMRFSKARAIHGEAAQPLDVRLVDVPGGGLDWSWRPAGQSQRERADELLEAGASVADVAREVSVSRATVYRWKKAVEGDLSHVSSPKGVRQ